RPALRGVPGRSALPRARAGSRRSVSGSTAAPGFDGRTARGGRDRAPRPSAGAARGAERLALGRNVAVPGSEADGGRQPRSLPTGGDRGGDGRVDRARPTPL